MTEPTSAHRLHGRWSARFRRADRPARKVTIDTATTTSTASAQAAWTQALRRTGLVYLFSRLCVMLGAAIVAAELGADRLRQGVAYPNAPFADPDYATRAIPKSAFKPMVDVLTSWDGAWYVRIVRFGYPRHVQAKVTYNVLDARAAFFPTYPDLVRLVDHIVPGHDVLAALLVNFVLGGVAIWLVGLIARRLYDGEVAEKAMVLMAVFPGSFVLSFAYSEALLLAVAAWCLLCLMRKQWWAAGALAAIGTATRPNGLALCLACAVAAYLAIRHERDWRALAAPLLSPLGFVAFQIWVGIHAHERGVWFRVQRQAWNEGTSFGFTAIRRSALALVHPLTSPADLITAVCVLAMLVLVWMLWTYRLPLPQVAYIAGVLFLMLVPKTVTARPRFLYTAFPLLIPAAVYFTRRGRELWPYVVAACAAGLVGLTGLYGVFGAIP
jgi:Dolichyl-phosphate-mannose-protein mannosyltransferase